MKTCFPSVYPATADSPRAHVSFIHPFTIVEMPELSASVVILAGSQVALVSQQARWQRCVGSVHVCGQRARVWTGAVKRRASSLVDCSHSGCASVPAQLRLSLQLELLMCSICDTCLQAEPPLQPAGGGQLRLKVLGSFC